MHYWSKVVLRTQAHNKEAGAWASIDHEELSDSSHKPYLLSAGQIPISNQALK